MKKFAAILSMFCSGAAYAVTADDVECVRCVGRSDLQSGAVVNGKIRAGTITGSRLKDGTITEDKLADEVTDEIDDLAERIAALEAANSGLNNGDLTGKVYCIIGRGMELTSDAGGSDPGIYKSLYTSKITFTSPTQASAQDLSDVEAFLNTANGNIDTDASSASSSETVNYTVTGSILTIDGESFLLTPDANVILGGFGELQDGGETQGTDLLVAVLGDAC